GSSPARFPVRTSTSRLNFWPASPIPRRPAIALRNRTWRRVSADLPASIRKGNTSAASRCWWSRQFAIVLPENVTGIDWSSRRLADGQESFMKFAGRNALITGASLGIGRALAIELARQGANVAINFRSHRENAEEVKAEVEKLGRKALLVQADVA